MTTPHEPPAATTTARWWGVEAPDEFGDPDSETLMRFMLVEVELGRRIAHWISQTGGSWTSERTRDEIRTAVDERLPCMQGGDPLPLEMHGHLCALGPGDRSLLVDRALHRAVKLGWLVRHDGPCTAHGDVFHDGQVRQCRTCRVPTDGDYLVLDELDPHWSPDLVRHGGPDPSITPDARSES